MKRGLFAHVALVQVGSEGLEVLEHRGLVLPNTIPISYEIKTFLARKSTARIKNVLRRKIHCQKGFTSILFSYEIALRRVPSGKKDWDEKLTPLTSRGSRSHSSKSVSNKTDLRNFPTFQFLVLHLPPLVT